jgi:phosphohistidine swiveling domain-containing protein
MFYGHLFLNLSQLYRVVACILGGSKEDIDFSLCGYVTEVKMPPPPAPKRTRAGGRLSRFLFNASFFIFKVWYLIRFLSNLLQVKKFIAKLRVIIQKLPSYESVLSSSKPNTSEHEKQDTSNENGHSDAEDKDKELLDAEKVYLFLTNELDNLAKAYETHLWSSAVSATWQGQLLRLLGGKTRENQETLAGLLKGIGNVASADMLLALEEVSNELVAQAKDGQCVLLDDSVDAEEKLNWLQSSQAERAGVLFRLFLQRHGHRSFREAEMRQPGWEDDPRSILAMLATALRAKVSATASPSTSAKMDVAVNAEKKLNWLVRMILMWGIKRASDGVRQREETKSLCVQLQNYLKKGYRLLATKLVRAGRLPEEDLVFFFTHEELQILLKADEQARTALIHLATKRRNLLPTLQNLQFPNLSQPGKAPRPIVVERSAITAHGNGTSGNLTLEGMGVSSGIAIGRARVVLDIEQAMTLQKGEILICPFTDVAWTPFFSIIGGVASDIGGLISHGAVVAREYGLPCVVDLHDATQQFRTGDLVCLDGNKGSLTRLEEK